jgi:Fe-S cluster assembly ATPase SufC
MNEIKEAKDFKDFEEIKSKINNLLIQEKFNDIEIEGFCGGGENRLDILNLTVKARKSRGKEKVYDK